MSDLKKETDETTMADLIASNKALANRLDELIHLQRVAMLEDGHILRFLFDDEEIALSIPLAERDFIQRNILKSGSFYEIRLLDLLRQRAGIKTNGIFYDVGANIGNHTVYFSKVFKPRQIVSIEPQKTAAKLLERNVALNDITQCTVVNCLLGRGTGHGAISTFGATNLGGTSFREDAEGAVEMRSLDSIVDEHSDGVVDFVKIDVEGMHLEVLEGAEKVLSNSRPDIWIELRDFKGEYDDAAKVFDAHGYRQALKLGAHDFLFSPVKK